MKRRAFIAGAAGLLLPTAGLIAPAKPLLQVTQLNGFGMGGGPVSGFTLVGSDSAADATIDLTGISIAGGDLCVVFNAAYSSGAAPASVTPTDFTVLDDATGAVEIRMMISAKILNGSETTLTGMNGGFGEQWVAAVFRPNGSLTSFAGNSFLDSITTGNPSALNVTAASAATHPVIVVGHMFGATNPVDPRTTSPSMEEIAGSSTAHYAHYLVYAAGAGDQSYDMADEGSYQGIQAGYLTFT